MTTSRASQLAACLLAFVAANPAGAAQTWEIRSETVYSKGNYGTGITTEVLYAPLEIRRLFEWGEIGLTVPYLWYRTSGNFFFVNNAVGPQIQSVAVSGSGEGIADLLLDAQFRILSQKGNRPEVLVRGFWKPPTASSKAGGVGTGSHDWILGTEFWSWLPGSDRWFYFGDIYHNFAGDRTGQTVQNSWIYDFGLGGVVVENLVAKVSYKEQTPVAPGVPTARSVVLETEYSVNSDFRILSGFTVGLSDAAPDWSAMLGFERTF